MPFNGSGDVPPSGGLEDPLLLLSEGDFFGALWAVLGWIEESRQYLHIVLVVIVLGRCLMSYFGGRTVKPLPEYENAVITEIISVAQYKKLLDSNQKVVIDFYAPSCRRCALAAIPFGKLSETYSKVGWVFGKCSVDQCPKVAFHADIKCMPTFKVYERGKEVHVFEGFQLRRIDEVLKGEKPEPPSAKPCCGAHAPPEDARAKKEE